MRPLAVLVVTAGLLTCGPAPATSFEILRPLALDRCTPLFAPVPIAPPAVLRALSPTTLAFDVRAALLCESGRRLAPEAWHVEVVDDGGRTIEATTRLTPGPEPDTMGLAIAFTSPASGQVSITLRVEPSIGVRQVVLPVVTPSSRVWRQSGWRDCLGLIEGPTGEEGCVRLRADLTPVVVLPGLDGGALPAVAWASTANLGWLVRSDRRLIWTSGGSAWPHPDAGRVPGPFAIAARGERVVLATVAGLLELTEAGDVFGPVPAASGEFVLALQFVDDETLLVTSGGAATPAPTPSRSRQPFALPRPLERRTTLGMSRHGLWFIDGPSGTRALERPDGGVVRAPFHVRVAFSTASVQLVDVLPVARLADGLGGVPVEVDDGGLLLDPVESPPGTQFSWATSRWLFASGDGGLWLAPREP